ncbi:uncharacterized protein LOC132197904 [Neocloeon triangulifer]|uniref:uncharacterized protein LOC132197904 n=1 Tax=Neocloeon triangulifer TaxID=2078957 RepID=UPI00286F1CD8|nr:uncharacterized protein LOC132197904 [Neocloeon triangulifer]
MASSRKRVAVHRALQTLVNETGTSLSNTQDSNAISFSSQSEINQNLSQDVFSQNSTIPSSPTFETVAGCSQDSSTYIVSDSDSDSDYSLPTTQDSMSSDDEIEFESDTERLVKELRRLCEKYPKVPQSFLEELCKFLSSTKVFRDLPVRAPTLLKTDLSTNVIKDSTGESFNLGIVHAVSEHLLRSDLLWKKAMETKSIPFSFKTDGVSLHKAPVFCKTAWPIVGQLHYDGVESEPFVIKMYFGESKPDHTEFFKDFVEELKLIDTIKIKDVDFKFKLLFATGDAPARSLLKCTAGHTATKACEKCTVVGKSINHRMDFAQAQVTEPILRTHESFLNRDDPAHHSGHSLFEQVESMNMITSFPLEPMHALDEGVTKRLIKHMFVEKKGKARLTQQKSVIVGKRLDALKEFSPRDFERKLVALRHLRAWKATMFRQVDTYFLPVLFKGVVDDEVFDHLMQFFSAVRILRSPVMVTKPEAVETAGSLLRSFVSNYNKFYGKGQTVFNVHCMQHLHEDVQNLKKTLDYFSTYSTETKLGHLVRLIRTGHSAAAQVQRRLSESREVRVRQLDQDPVVYLRHKKGPLRALRFRRIELSLNTKGDSFYMDWEGQIFKLLSVRGDHGDDPILVSNMLVKTGDFFHTPYPSSSLGIHKVEFSSVQTQHPLSKVAAKMILMPFDGTFVAMPILHTCV